MPGSSSLQTISAMRTIRFFLFVLLAAGMTAAAVSCVEPLATGGRLSVAVSLVPEGLSTKAAVAGDDVYNENLVSYVDWWLYASGAASATSLAHGRVTSLTKNSSVSWTALVDLAAWAEALGGEGATGYLLLAANLPSGTTVPSSGTREQILATALSATFTAGTQDRFPMVSVADAQFTVASGHVSTSATLRRIAAKLTLTATVPVSITDGGMTYEPDASSLRAYFVNTVQTAVLSGEPVASPSLTRYAERSPVSVVGDGPWTETAAPFYSYPHSWVEDAVDAPYFKISLGWRREGASVKPYYYKVLMPASMGWRIDANTLHRFTVSLGVLGGETEDDAVTVSAAWTVEPWKEGGSVGLITGEQLSRGTCLEIARSDYQLYADNTITIPVLSSHDISVTVNSAKYTDYSSATATERTITSGSYMITTSGRTSLTLTHTLNEDIGSTNLHCSLLTFDLTVRNEAGLSQRVVITQYPSIYITSEESNKYAFINGTTNQFSNSNYKLVYETGYSTSAYRLGTIRSYRYSNTNNNNFNIYTINVTNLKNSDYYIGDPRSRTTVTYQNLKGTSTSGAALTGYRPVDAGSSDLIAPAFKLASSSGASFSTSNNNGRVSYEYANRRCAAYQESGYPAGRWRMPTDAEIRFCIGLSNAGKIPPLFKGNYWASSGVVLTINSSNEIEEVPDATTAAVRCVYDSWYWGDAPVEAYKKTWSGWQN